jgi:hypothetical protein
MIKPISIAVALAVALSAAGGAHAAKKNTKSKKHRANAELTMPSDAKVVNLCNGHHGVALAACLHEARGDEYAPQWIALAAALGSTATGATGSPPGTSSAVPAR